MKLSGGGVVEATGDEREGGHGGARGNIGAGTVGCARRGLARADCDDGSERYSKLLRDHARDKCINLVLAAQAVGPISAVAIRWRVESVQYRAK